MLPLLLGVLALAAFLGGLRAFERAPAVSLPGLLRWTGTLGALALVLLLVLTGWELPALGVAILAGTALWGWWHPKPAGPRNPGGAMDRAEAAAVLGVAPDAPPAAIRAAHRREIRAAHQDAGGSTARAARVNRARDVLLRGR